MELPPNFPNVEHSEGNEFRMERWSLGKKLFFDTILSKDGSTSCASCHNPELAFSDNDKFSLGFDGAIGTRNSSPLFNVAYHPYFTREGGVPTLEFQVLVPIQEHNEFNNNIVLIADTLSKIPAYFEMSMAAYDQPPTPYVITRSLAQFERSLISGQSLFDLEINYQIKNSMTEAALRGMDLFNGSVANCSTCHGGFNFTNYTFQNNGLYEEYLDEGRERLTGEESDVALFKVPSLRNIELTAPYMHDGSMDDLETVIEHYISGGKNHINKSKIIRPFQLNQTEKQDLLAFLKSLTDENFISNKQFQND